MMSSPLQNKSDEEIVKLALQNVDNFAILFERYEKKLLNYIFRISNFTPEEAEEVLQEAFLKIWQNLNAFDDDFKFSSWAYRIVHNETISQFKKSKSFGKDKRQELDDKLFAELPSKLDLESEINRKLNGEHIRQILNKMPEKYRTVLILKFLEDKSYQEISDILKKPEGTVATLINRAKKNFSSQLESKQEFNLQL